MCIHLPISIRMFSSSGQSLLYPFRGSAYPASLFSFLDRASVRALGGRSDAAGSSAVLLLTRKTPPKARQPPEINQPRIHCDGLAPCADGLQVTLLPASR